MQLLVDTGGPSRTNEQPQNSPRPCPRPPARILLEESSGSLPPEASPLAPSTPSHTATSCGRSPLRAALWPGRLPVTETSRFKRRRVATCSAPVREPAVRPDTCRRRRRGLPGTRRNVVAPYRHCGTPESRDRRWGLLPTDRLLCACWASTTSMSRPLELFLTTADVAGLAGVSTEAVRKWARVGQLPIAARSLSGIRFFRRADVVTVIRQRQRRLAAEKAVRPGAAARR